MAPRLSAVCCSEKELKRRLSKSPYSMTIRGHTKSAFSRSKSQTPKKLSPASRTAQNKRIFQYGKTIDPSEISLFSSTPSDAATGVASHAKSNLRKDKKLMKRADPSQISLFSSTLSKNNATGAANHSHSSSSKDVQEKRGPSSEMATPAKTLSVKVKRGLPRINSRIDPDKATTPKKLRSADDVVFRQTDFLARYKSSFATNNGEADTESCWDAPIGESVDQAVMEMGCGRDPIEDIHDFDNIFEDVLEDLEEEI